MKHQREKTKKEKRDRKKNVPERKQILFWNPSWTSLDTLMSSSKTWEGSLKKGMKMIKTVDKRTVALIWYFWGFNGHESFHKMRSRKENNRFSSKSTFKVLFQIKARTTSYLSEDIRAKREGMGFDLTGFILPSNVPSREEPKYYRTVTKPENDSSHVSIYTSALTWMRLFCRSEILKIIKQHWNGIVRIDVKTIKRDVHNTRLKRYKHIFQPSVMDNQKHSRPQLFHFTKIFTESGEKDQSDTHASMSCSSLRIRREIKKRNEMEGDLTASKKAND